MTITSRVERRIPAWGGHGVGVGALGAELAATHAVALKLTPVDIEALELAGRVHAVGLLEHSEKGDTERARTLDRAEDGADLRVAAGIVIELARALTEIGDAQADVVRRCGELLLTIGRGRSTDAPLEARRRCRVLARVRRLGALFEIADHWTHERTCGQTRPEELSSRLLERFQGRLHQQAMELALTTLERMHEDGR